MQVPLRARASPDAGSERICEGLECFSVEKLLYVVPIGVKHVL